MKLPHNEEAEQCVLGACLLEREAAKEVVDSVYLNDFHQTSHQEIFKAIQSLAIKKMDIDCLSLGNAVPKELALYASRLYDSVPSATNIKTYIKILKAYSMRRRLIKEAISLQEAAQDTDSDIDDVLLAGQKSILSLSISKESPLKNTKELALALYRKIENQDPHAFQGLQTGYKRLDWILGGMKPGKLYIMAARPRMGKTALSKNIAEYVAAKAGAVFIASLEMDAEQLAIRHISGMSKINGNKFNTGRFAEDDWSRLTEGAGKYGGLPIFYDDAGFQTDLGIASKARKVKAEHGLSLVIIDYLQLVKASGRTNSREEYVASISRNLKAISKELHVPILCLAQLNRECEREKRKPLLSDLRESGGIEQDADAIIFIHRDHEYNPNSPESQAEIIVAKNRDGGTGTVELVWNGEHTNFYDKGEL